MAQVWSSQDEDDPDDVGAWMVRRNAEIALRSQADAVARDLWNQTTQDGGELYAGNPSDLTAIGLSALDGPVAGSMAANDDDQGAHDPPGRVASSPLAGPRQLPVGTRYGAATFPDQAPDPGPSAPAATYIPAVSELEVMGPRPAQSAHPGFLDDLNHNSAVRAAGGVAGYLVGLPAGALRAGLHALEGLGHGLNFAGGLIYSPGARAEAWDEAQAATHGALQYGRSVLADPSRLGGDALSAAKAANRSLNPFATPIPDTASGTFNHEFGIGANGGETLTDRRPLRRP